MKVASADAGLEVSQLDPLPCPSVQTPCISSPSTVPRAVIALLSDATGKDRARISPKDGIPGKHLKFLRKMQRVAQPVGPPARERPCSCQPGRYIPQGYPVGGDRCVRICRPFAHLEGIADDARAWLAFREDSGTQPHIERVQQVKRDHRGIPDFRGEDVRIPKLHQRLDAGASSASTGLSEPLRIDIDPDSARAVLARRGDDDPAIPAAEIEDHIPRAHIREPEHLGDHSVRRRREINVGRGILGLHAGTGANGHSAEASSSAGYIQISLKVGW